VIEDDYDAEYRYDRAPLAALQGLAPDRVVYMGTVSKTLAPASASAGSRCRRACWTRSSSRRASQTTVARRSISSRSPGCLRRAPTTATCARLAASTGRDATRWPPPSLGISPALGSQGSRRGSTRRSDSAARVDGIALVQTALSASVGVYPLGYAYMQVRPVHDGLVLGYANLTEPAIEEGIRRLAGALEGLP